MTTQEIITHWKELASKVALMRSRIEWFERSADMSASAVTKLEVLHAELRQAICHQNNFLLIEWQDKPCSNP